MPRNKQTKDSHALIRVSQAAKAKLDRLAAERQQPMRQVIDGLLDGNYNLSARSTRWVNSKAKELGLTQQQVLERVICEHRGQKIQDELDAHYIARREAAETTDMVDDATLVAVSSSLRY